MREARCHPDMPVVSHAYFANFTPETFALITEGLVLPYIVGYLPCTTAGLPWAALRAVDRGEATCPALAALSARQIEKEHVTWTKGQDPRRATLDGVEKEYAFFRADILPRVGGLSLDFHKTVTAAELLAAVFEGGPPRSWAHGPWQRAGHTIDAIHADLLAPGGFVASETFADRGRIPAGKRALYEKACELAAYHGLWLIRGLEVEMAAVELGVSTKRPQRQRAIQRRWDDSVRCAREQIDKSGCCSFVSFPGPRPWALSAAETLGVPVAFTHEDRQAWPTADELPSLQAELMTDDVDKLWWATVRIGRLAAGAAPAVPDLVKLLKDDRAIVRQFGAEALAAIGLTAKPAAGDLADALKDPEPDVIYSVLGALSAMGPAGAQAAPTLLAMLKDDACPWRGHAAGVLGRIGTAAGEVASALVDSLRHEPAPDLRTAAMEGLSRLGADKELVVPVLIEALVAEDWGVRHQAASTLAEFGRGAPEAVPALISVLKTKELPGEEPVMASFSRGAAARALGEIGPAAVGAVDALLEASQEDDRNVSIPATLALASLGPAAKKALPIFLERLNDAPEAAPLFVEAIGLLGALARPAIPRLLDILVSGKGMTRKAAAWALGEIGDDDEIVEALWAAATMDVSRPVRAAIAAVLAKVAPAYIPRLGEALAEELNEALESDDPLGRLHAAHAIARLENGNRGVEALVGMASDIRGMPTLRLEAAKLLADLGPLAAPALPALHGAARERDPGIRFQAKKTIRAIEAIVDPRCG